MEIFGSAMEIENFWSWKLTYLQASDPFSQGLGLKLFLIFYGMTQKTKILFDTVSPLCNAAEQFF